MNSSSSTSEDISPHPVVMASCAVNSGDTNQTDSNNKTKQQQVNNNSNNDLLPIEYQLYEVDLTNPEMDPLEYTFRKYVPIPKESPRLVLVCCVKNVVSVILYFIYDLSNKVQLTCRTNMHYVYHPFMNLTTRIFQVYFWESANETNDYNQSLPIRIKAWHNTTYYKG